MATTQIQTRQIADNAITKEKIPAGAAIETSKLAEGADFIRRTGAVAFTGAQSMGGFKITNVGTPSANSTDAATTAYVDAAIGNLNSLFDSKPSVRVATTTNGALATAFANGQSVDGLVLVTGDRILLKNQTAPAENGIYVVAVSGAPTRALDMDTWNEIPGAFVAVEVGATNADTIWLGSADSGGTLNTTAITWMQIPTTAGLLNANFVDKETPSGTINGSNVTFTLADTPVAGSEHIYLNGVLQDVGAGNDYTISGATITYLTAPLTGEKIKASYRK
jgi:hypothetical protein